MYVAKVRWFDGEGDCCFHNSVVILAAERWDKAAADLMHYFGEDMEYIQICRLEGGDVYDISLNNPTLGGVFFDDALGEDDGYDDHITKMSMRMNDDDDVF